MVMKLHAGDEPGYITRYRRNLLFELPLLRRPEQLWLPDVPTVIYTADGPCRRGGHHDGRRARCQAIMKHYGFTNWRFFFGRPGRPYWQAIVADWIQLLGSWDPPVLILEDDIEPRAFQPGIDVPTGSQVVYLGGGRGGESQGVRAGGTIGLFPKKRWRYGYIDINHDWFRCFGMWYSHAILFLDRRSMTDLAVLLCAADRPIDSVLARNQWRWNCVCRKVPMFWQNDGHHLAETYSYF